MPVSSAAARDGADRCPGVVSVHPAADGGLARIRIPGGLVSAGQVRVIAAAATDLGAGVLELTSRGNVQLRGLAPGAEVDLADRLWSAGLLPSVSHEGVRNFVASPLAGIDTGPDIGPLLRALDGAWCAQPRLADLPGRFLVAVDDGRGDVAGPHADITVTVQGPHATVGPLAVSTADVVATTIAVAIAFLDERVAQRSGAWRVAELDGGIGRVAERARETLSGNDIRHADPRPVVPPAEPVGPIRQYDGGVALAVLAPLGRLTATQAGVLADLAGGRGPRITPWRSIVLPDLADLDAATRTAGQAGLGVDRHSPWYRLSACTGRPGCARALADVQSDARTTRPAGPGQADQAAQAVHWSGCERRCGRPAGTAVDVVATPAGYQIRNSIDA